MKSNICVIERCKKTALPGKKKRSLHKGQMYIKPWTIQIGAL